MRGRFLFGPSSFRWCRGRHVQGFVLGWPGTSPQRRQKTFPRFARRQQRTQFLHRASCTRRRLACHVAGQNLDFVEDADFASSVLSRHAELCDGDHDKRSLFHCLSFGQGGRPRRRLGWPVTSSANAVSSATAGRFSGTRRAVSSESNNTRNACRLLLLTSCHFPAQVHAHALPVLSQFPQAYELAP